MALVTKKQIYINRKALTREDAEAHIERQSARWDAMRALIESRQITWCHRAGRFVTNGGGELSG